MAVRIERSDRVLTVIHSRAERRNAVDPDHAEALYRAFLAFDADETTDVAVFWGEGGAFCAGADLKSLATPGIATPDNPATHYSLEFPKDSGPVPRGPMGPSRLRLGKPVIAAIEGPAVAAAWSSHFGPTAASWRRGRIWASIAGVGACRCRMAAPCDCRASLARAARSRSS